MGKIKDENYYQISGWMINKLNLKGTSLNVFAIIYGFTQDGESEFSGSIGYLCEWLNVSRPTISKALEELTNQNYLTKHSIIINNVIFNRYKVNLDVVKKFIGGSKETLQGSKETLQGGSKETLHNNNILNNNINNNIKKERKKETTYDKIINDLISNEEIKDLIYEFIKMRALKKKPLTDRALKIQINKLHKLSGDIEEQKKIIEKAIVKAWDEFYPINSFVNKGVSNGSYQKSDGSEYEEFDER